MTRQQQQQPVQQPVQKKKKKPPAYRPAAALIGAVQDVGMGIKVLFWIFILYYIIEHF